MKRAVAYVRFSSAGQREESIQAQKRAINAYCIQNNIKLIKTYEDHAKSATTDNRPQFLKLIKESRYKEYDYVIVHKLDRFARNRYDSASYKLKLKKNGKQLLSVLENIDGSPESIIMESVLEGMAEYYSANLSREVKKGIDENMRSYKFIGGNVPYGYDIVDGQYTINEQEAKGVQKIFEMYLLHYTYADIMKYLNTNGYRTKAGNKFTNNSVIYSILKRRLYKGDYVKNLGKEREFIAENVIDPIIDAKTFEEVQEIMKVKQIRSSKKSDYDYLLSGIIYHKCEDGTIHKMIGSSGRGKGGRKYYYYKCKHCNTWERADKLEKQICEFLTDVIFYKNNIEQFIQATYQSINDFTEDNNEKEVLENKIKEITKEIDQYSKAIAKGLISDQIIEKVNSLEQQKQELKFNLSKITEKEHITLDEVREYFYINKNNLFKDRKHQKKVIQTLIKKIVASNTQVNVELSTLKACSLTTFSGRG